MGAVLKPRSWSSAAVGTIISSRWIGTDGTLIEAWAARELSPERMAAARRRLPPQRERDVSMAKAQPRRTPRTTRPVPALYRKEPGRRRQAGYLGMF